MLIVLSHYFAAYKANMAIIFSGWQPDSISCTMHFYMNEPIERRTSNRRTRGQTDGEILKHYLYCKPCCSGPIPLRSLHAFVKGFRQRESK